MVKKKPVKKKPSKKPKTAKKAKVVAEKVRRMTADELREPDIEDRKILKGKAPNYIMGWNKVKYKQGFDIS